MPDISVIVLNYNGLRWLAPCLDALGAQRGAPPFEVLLVDNASSDGSAAFVREKYPAVRVIETGSNLGFAAGNNHGARHAAGAWLAFLNNDTAPSPDWLARLHESLLSRPGYAFAASRLVFLDRPGVVDSAGDGYFRAGGAFKRGYGGRAADYDTPQEVFGACGAALLIRRDLFEALGGFDERFFMVYEDVDLSYRARLRGHRCWYAADAVVRHAVSGTLGLTSASAVYHGQRNLEWTWLKNTPRGLLWRTALPHAAYSLAGLLHYARRGQLGPALRGKIAALTGIPAILRARADVQRSSVVASSEIAGRMATGWIAAKMREKSV